MIDRLRSDVAFALRTHAARPGATLVIVCTLALGIAATSVSFSVVNGFFVRPLPIHEPERFVRLYNSYKRADPYFTFSYPDFVDMRALRDVFVGAVAEQPEAFTVQIGGVPERVWGDLISERYFTVLGLKPAVGRFLADGDESPQGGEPVVVLGYGLWRRAFGGRPDVVGARLLVNGRTFRVIGVAPERFTGTILGFVADLWIPASAERQIRAREERTERGYRGWFGMARLQPNVGITQARAALDALAERLQRDYPGTNAGVGFTALPESEGRIFPLLRGSVLGASAVTTVVAVLVLIIACANVSGLLLVRATARRTEMAVRLALGASRRRIVAQLLTESAVLAAAAGAIGLALSWKLTELVAAYRLTIARGAPVSVDVTLDARVALSSALVIVAAALIFGLMPALEAARSDVIPALKSAPASGGSSRAWLRTALVALQIAVSTMLLAGCGLFLRSFAHARQIDLGFEPDHVITASIDLSAHAYSDAESRTTWRRIIREVRQMPGVEAASMAARMPLDLGLTRMELGPDGYQPTPGQAWPQTEFARVETDYFRTMRIPLLDGRDFSDRDRDESPAVIIVNDVVARQFWPKAPSAVGKTIATPGGERFAVIGVARRSKYFSIGEEPKRYVYFPLQQGAARTMTIAARVAGDPGGRVQALVARLHAIDPLVPIYDVTTMAERVAVSMAPASGGAAALAIVGLLALVLTSLGLYGIVAQTVSRRTYEIGVRRALGAQDRDIATLVLGSAMALVIGGLAAGLVAAFGGARLLRTLLYAVDAGDPIVFAVTPAVLVGVCAVAAALPTWRAIRISAARALRYE
jgi:putative ABC transport system permease protein